jgi:Chaperone of endosialidase
MERTRNFLKPVFKDGERPSGDDFGDLIDSFVNKQTDGVSFDNDGNFVLTRGVQLGDSAGAVPGGLRFNSNQLQVFTGGAWVNVASGGGEGFQAPPTTPNQPAVARDGLVGIGSFPAAPTYRLEVNLGANTGPANQVKFGNAVCSNGTSNLPGVAIFAHFNHATDTNFALMQDSSGAVQINAKAQQAITITQGAAGPPRLGVTAALGHVIVGGGSELPGAPNGAVFQVAGDVFKLPSNVWGTSDARVKEDVRDLELGLAELRQVRPVRFRYNGRAGTPAGRAGIGVLGQEIETIIPETIQRVSVADDPGLGDMRVFDPAALTYVLINAVKELAARVEQLEQALAAAADNSGSGPVIA